MLAPISIERHSRLRVEIRYDPDRPNPREEEENLGTIVGWTWPGRRVLLGDRQADVVALSAVRQVMRPRQNGARIVLPVYYTSHGPHCALELGEDTAPESIERSSGVIYITLQQLRAVYGRPFTGAALAAAHRALAGEVAEYSAYLNGSVYGFVITDDQEGSQLEDGWGYYDLDECEKDARAAAADCAERQAAEDREANEMACRDIPTTAA